MADSRTVFTLSPWIDRRRSGVLLHITSLHGPFDCGVLGEEAHAFVDSLATGGFTVWQFLPLGPTHGHGSPYESLSSFAGNPRLLDLRDCVRQGWLRKDTCEAVIKGKIEPGIAWADTAEEFWEQTKRDASLAGEIRSFCVKNKGWLDDYALFAALKIEYADQPWWQWPGPLRNRKPESLKRSRQEHAAQIRQTQFEQFLFARQWQSLKKYSESRGVLLFGDLPIYAAHDSADVWAQQSYFTVNKAGLCEEVAGVPPDYFSETGQRWGNPLYRWDRLAENGFDWWLKRVQTQLLRMHLLRIDHFRALQAYWAIPGKQPDGRIGEWRPARGEELLEVLESRLKHLPLVAEDLGMITPEVHALRERFGLPGMKVLQFAFDGDADNPYLPCNHEPDSVVYTGTHDNDTTLGWFQNTPDDVRAHIAEYLDTGSDDMPWPLIYAALESKSRLAIIPMQDLMSLGGEDRLNTPGTTEGNWAWRLQSSPTDDIWTRTRELNQLLNRY